MTIASFIDEGMQPLVIDIFTISVIIGESISTHCISKLVGNGSSEHDFDGEFVIFVIIYLMTIAITYQNSFNMASGRFFDNDIMMA